MPHASTKRKATASALDRIEEGTLDRDYFEELTMDQIKNEAKWLNVLLLPDRLVNAIIIHLERLSPPQETAYECERRRKEPELLVEIPNEQLRSQAVSEEFRPVEQSASREDNLARAITLISQQMQQQNEMFQQVLLALRSGKNCFSEREKHRIRSSELTCDGQQSVDDRSGPSGHSPCTGVRRDGGGECCGCSA